MTISPCRSSFFIEYKDLHQLLLAVQEKCYEQRSQQIVSISLAIDFIDPLVVLDKFAQKNTLNFYFENRSKGEPIVAIDAIKKLDISGQKRPTAGNLKDIGCDEFGGGPIINKPLRRQDVGPIYLKNDLVSISMEKSSTDNNIIIYPNPVSSSLTVKITEQAEKLDVTFYDETGRQVGYFPQNNSTPSKDEFVYSVSNVPNGIYFINFKSGKFLKTLKLIVQH